MKVIYKIFSLAVTCLLISIATVGAQDTGVDWHELNEAQQLAKKNGKKVLVYAEASWCPYCKRMEKEVLSKTDIQETMSQYFYPVRINIESDQKVAFNGKEMTQQDFSQQMRVSGTPTFFFIDNEGSVIGAQPGFIPRDVYKSLLTYVGDDIYNQMQIKEYLKQ